MIKAEWKLLIVWAFAILFKVYGDIVFSDLEHAWLLISVFVILFTVIMIAAFAVVRHADILAEILGEPLGTLILTMSVIIIEVSMISAVMITGSDNPTMARDTMFSIIMIVMNGLVGFALLFGGFKHREQVYNLQGTNTFLAIIFPLAVLGLILPNYTYATDTPTFSSTQSITIALATLGLYIVFLAVQTVTHRGYFDQPLEGNELTDDEESEIQTESGRQLVLIRHSILLVAYLIPVIMLAKSIAIPVEYGIRGFGLPSALGGFVIALLVLSPEALGALEAALKNQLQRSINIFLGSVTATIGLTIPAVLAISVIVNEPLVLGLSVEDSLLLATTLAVSMITFNSGHTNILLGAVHLALFAIYIMLIFDGVYA